MSATSAASVFVGTRGGLFRRHGGTITPLSAESDAIGVLAPGPGGRVFAATLDGRLLRVDPEGLVREIVVSAPDDAITSLLCIAGAGGATTLLAGTAQGWLLESGDLGETFRRVTHGRLVAPASLRVSSVPGRPRAALLLAVERGVWLLEGPGEAPRRWTREEGAGERGDEAADEAPRDEIVRLFEIVAHPGDGQVWLARAADRLLRSSDGARTFRPVAGWPAPLRPRLVHFTSAPLAAAYAVAWPAADPPDPTDPSPLWQSRDAGQSFHPVLSHLIDRARDPSGEITALTSWRERDQDLVAFGTNRGELLEWRSPDRPATLLATDLPPIETLLALPARTTLDPSTSGIHLLP